MNGWTQAWFWTLLVGLILVIIGAIIRGVNCEMNWWSGSLFLLGFILVLIGVALALWNWASMATAIEKKAYVSASPAYQQYSLQCSPQYPHQYSPQLSHEDVMNKFKYANHPQVIHSPHVISSPSPIVSVPALISSPSPTVQRVVSLPTLPPITTVRTLPTTTSVVSTPSATSIPLSNSPIIPTPVTTNIPQAQRGFSTSGMDLSALSPV